MRRPKFSRHYPTLVASLALTIALSSGAVAATGGALILGRSNTAGSTTSLSNTNGTALSLNSKAGTSPIRVNRSVKVKNLNADLLDGLDSSSLQRRVTGTCPAGQAMSGVTATGMANCTMTLNPSIDSLAGTDCAGPPNYTFPGSMKGHLQVVYDVPPSPGVQISCVPDKWFVRLGYYVGFASNTSTVSFNSPASTGCSPNSTTFQHNVCAAWVPEERNSTVNLVVTPGDGVGSWTWGGACSGSGTTCDLALTQTYTDVTISFAPK